MDRRVEYSVDEYRCLGTVSNALIGLLYASRVLSAGLLEFRLSRAVSERCVRRVGVECKDLKRYCVLERGMCVFMLLRINISSILRGCRVS